MQSTEMLKRYTEGKRFGKNFLWKKLTEIRCRKLGLGNALINFTLFHAENRF